MEFAAQLRSICRTLDANLATPVCSASSAGADGNDWAAGWVVFEKVLPNVDESNVEVEIEGFVGWPWVRWPHPAFA